MPAQRLTDVAIRALIKRPRTKDEEIADAALSGLLLRLSPAGTATWSQIVRVAGEGGLSAHGRPLLGKRRRIYIGNYPMVTLEAARAKANRFIAEAKRGINPKEAIAAAATAGTLTVEALSKVFMEEYVHSRGLDSADLYANAFKVHILPKIGGFLADLVTREDARRVMNAARTKRPRPDGRPGARIGGIEAARTAMRVMQHMYSWSIEEGKLKRTDNPCSNIIRNLPKAKKGEVVLSLHEARIVWQAAKDCGYPFGAHAQLMMLSACRQVEWAQAKTGQIDLQQALMVVSADDYKSDHVHVLPLVPQALQILKGIPGPTTGPFLFSSTGGDKPIRGVAKFFKTRLADQIIANTGEALSKKLTSHVLRRTVATRLAELLGYEGEKLVKRVLGHADGSVTAIYNRYGYVREMRRALEKWANELTGPDTTDLASEASIAGQPQLAGPEIEAPQPAMDAAAP